MDWFLYDIGLRHERAKLNITSEIWQQSPSKNEHKTKKIVGVNLKKELIKKYATIFLTNQRSYHDNSGPTFQKNC